MNIIFGVKGAKGNLNFEIGKDLTDAQITKAANFLRSNEILDDSDLTAWLAGSPGSVLNNLPVKNAKVYTPYTGADFGIDSQADTSRWFVAYKMSDGMTRTLVFVLPNVIMVGNDSRNMTDSHIAQIVASHFSIDLNAVTVSKPKAMT